MVSHNNMVPNGHFHKKWQPRIKLWFDQPMKKVRRHLRRIKKQTQLAPKPSQLLRPVVHCPTVRYNNKIRMGRGFTLQELKQAGINARYARTIGIAVDHRRRNRCVESLLRNAQRLKEFQQKLIVFPAEFKRVVKVDSGKYLNEVKKGQNRVKVRLVTEEEKVFEAYDTLRRARSDAKFAGVRVRRKIQKSEALDQNKVN